MVILCCYCRKERLIYPMDFTFQTDQIQIFVETQINRSKSTPITKSLLGMGNSTNYPYFTGWYKYEKDDLIRKKYSDRIDFFFNEEIFISTFKGKEKALTADTYVDENVKVMIEILFPTVYPIKNDNTTSFNTVMKINNNAFSLKGTLPFMGLLPSFDNTFSYLHMNNNIYTVSSTCILNDFINHPLYSTLIQQFLLFETWRNNTKNKITLALNKSKLTINSIIHKEYSTLSQVKDEINGSYILKNRNDVQKDKYIKELSSLLSHQLKIPIDKDSSENLKRIVKKIKENVFSMNVRFSLLTRHIKDFLEKSSVNDFFFLFKYPLSEMDSTTERYMEINYREYKIFYDKVGAFDSNHRITLNHSLQKIIDEYVQKKNFNFEQLLNFINNRYVKKRNHILFPEILRSYKIGNEKDYIYLGVTKYNYLSQINSTYEVYVNINLILGKVDASHLLKISCDYKNELLGNAFLDINSSTNTIRRPIIDLKDMLKSDKRPKNVRGGGDKKRKSLKKKIKKSLDKNKTKKKKKFDKWTIIDLYPY